jgi:hypothetical protein
VGRDRSDIRRALSFCWFYIVVTKDFISVNVRDTGRRFVGILADVWFLIANNMPGVNLILRSTRFGLIELNQLNCRNEAGFFSFSVSLTLVCKSAIAYDIVAFLWRDSKFSFLSSSISLLRLLIRSTKSNWCSL